MHSELDLTIDQITKIEGHARLDLKVRGGKVELVHFEITENKRFYTQAIRGKTFAAAPQLMSRICGTCSIAHLICCIQAVENALGIQPSPQTQVLRLLSLYGMYIRDHALHLYLFTLPDVLGKDSLLDLDENKPEERQWLEEAFAVKGAGNRLSQVIAGRAVHAPYPVVGGHLKAPSEAEAQELAGQLEQVRGSLFRLMAAFRDCPFRQERSTEFLALDCDTFLMNPSSLVTSENQRLSTADYYEHLRKVIIPYSQSLGYSFEGNSYTVGALARINLNRERLHASTRRDAAESLSLFPSSNVYHNNLAQAIETLHAIDHSLQLLRETKFAPERKAEAVLRAAEGMAALEAPRGILYYHVKLSEQGIIEDATVVVPTQQNQIQIERDIKEVVEKNLDKDREAIAFEIEKLVRAYDPCMSCASHFLKVRWL